LSLRFLYLKEVIHLLQKQVLSKVSWK